eukprot:gnl/TRDRNA2_/TRDRNA2_131318_c3_seq1.p1 gnl/TRDRNA2_/TRDRNA2_131318_c3~~gnl/TRDRNA2_/TRDRNA2_131318_c3_seq1.p1  ORF type:complete len:743 (-),score=213.22 gnl/TRDRNA2_/TRDRNA2_131318_c3_seq1:34-2019(-)
MSGMDLPPGFVPDLPMFLPPALLPPAMMMPVMPSMGSVDKVYWESNMAPQGVMYYYCKTSGESRWVMPAGPQDVVLPPGVPTPTVIAPAPAPAAVATPAARGPGLTAAEMKTEIGEPESWESIGRTPWLRVETDKGHTYFYHKKTKKTYWECPEEIKKQVDELDGVLAAPEETSPKKPEMVRDPSGKLVPSPEEQEKIDAKKKADEEAAAAAAAEKPKLTKAEKEAQRAEMQEKEQQLSKAKQTLKNFKELLAEKGVEAFAKYDKWLPKLLHDPRFTAVPGQKERKALFEALVKKIGSEKQKTEAAARKSGREIMKDIISKAEKKGLFKGGPSAALRAIERQFCDDDGWDAVGPKERERLITEAVEESDKKNKEEKDKAVLEFRELIAKTIRGKEDNPPRFRDVKTKMQEDARWEPVERHASRERLYDEYCRELETAKRKKQAQKRREMDEVEGARKKRRIEIATEDFLSLLAERVKAPFGVDFDDLRDLLEECSDLRGTDLTQDDQRRIWEEYKEGMIAARREAFLTLLANTSAEVIGPEMTFEQVLARTMDPTAARSFAGMPEDVMRSAWEDWREKAFEFAVECCRQWLRTSEVFRSAQTVPDSGPDFEILLARLGTDPRFQRLGSRPAEQRRLVVERLHELRDLKSKAKVTMEDDDDG